jgi:hypothetical protein
VVAHECATRGLADHVAAALQPSETSESPSSVAVNRR